MKNLTTKKNFDQLAKEAKGCTHHRGSVRSLRRHIVRKQKREEAAKLKAKFDALMEGAS